MLDDLLDIKVFVRVVATGSLSAAARELGLSLAAVSKRLASLEKRLAVILLRRTTRSQSLTVEGHAFYERCVRILAEVQDAEDFISGSHATVSGQLAITAPRTFGRQHIVPLIAEFRARYPALSIRLLLDDEVIDMVDAGIDVAFRFGALLDSTLTARLIAPGYSVLCASPEYAARKGLPTAPSQLAHHSCIVYGARPSAHWLFHVDGKPLSVAIGATFIVNDGGAAQRLALEGAGILFKSIWDVGSHIRARRLLHVMPDLSAPTQPLHAVFPNGRQLSPRVRHFLDFAIERLRDAFRSIDAPAARAGTKAQRSAKRRSKPKS